VKRFLQSVVLTLAIISAMLALPGVFASGQQSKPGRTPADFNREIRPILSDNCFACHGPDEQQRKARLRFDTKEGAFARPGVIVPGDAANSRLIKRITSKDPDTVMPPPDSGHKLSEQQIGLISRWIDEGANWNTHWAWLAPQRTEPPKIGNPAWARNAIDNFIHARLEKEGLKPSPEADRTTLLRRVTLDLTGLPPTPAEVDAFLADKSPNAYDKVVDRLLGSEHYGERMAMQWLDLARYADTHGFHIDSHRDMWPWRDWLINAFNSNKPFDQFTSEQLAGDLLPNATTEQKIASGFNRNHMINFEGGAIPEEYLTEYVVDRVETTANTWMAMTMGCARCHTHKYDPITQKEFYQFFAFFNSVGELGLDGQRGNAKPFLPLPTEEQKKKQEELSKAIRALEESLSDKQITPLQEAWEQTLAGKTAAAPREDLSALFDLDGSLADSSGNFQHGRTRTGDPTFGGGMVSRAVFFDGQTEVGFGHHKTIAHDQPFTIAFWMRPGLGKIGNYVLQQIADEQTRRGFELIFEATQLVDIQRWAAPLTIRLISHWPDSAIQLRTKERFTSGEWKHLTIASDGSGKAAGVKIFLNGKLSEAEINQDNLSGSLSNQAELALGNKQTGRAYSGGLDDLRIYRRVLTSQEIEQLAVHFPINTILSGVSGKRTKEESERLRAYFLTHVAADTLSQQNADLNRLRREKEALEKSILSVMVMNEQEKPRDTFILARGDYRNRTEKVSPGVPAVLSPLPQGAPANRLTLAKWLTDPAHPLTARVAVNRYWQMYFGHGIVKTSEDFGSQGEPPVHPELLDFLATEFIRSGWNIKAMQKLIVTSATYRQSSRVTPEPIEKDPENRLLARGPRFRLPAETVRDNALAVSGLLNQKIGGPSVSPYHPKGLWEEMAFGDGFSAQEYVQSHGADLYRRSLYTFWKRTVPPPTLVTFDAPDREKCVARRPLTNTPLQALILLNDPTYVEAARALAERALREGGKDTGSRITFAFRMATARKPSAEELRVLNELLKQQLRHYRSDQKAADQFLKVGESPVAAKFVRSELAAWTMVMSAILNLDETITKE
jgi:mono/diheme cytochrome c family protein